MKKYLITFIVLAFFTACGGGPDNEEEKEFETVTAEKTSKIDIDWSSLPLNQNIPSTTPLGVQQIIPITIDDFGVNSETAVYNPSVVGLYYDIQNLSSLSDINTLVISISVNINGLTERLTSITLSDLQNTSSNSGELAKIPIYTSDFTDNVNLNGVIGMNQSIAYQGRIVLELDIIGRDINLARQEDFDIVLSMDFQGSIEKK